MESRYFQGFLAPLVAANRGKTTDQVPTNDHIKEKNTCLLLPEMPFEMIAFTSRTSSL